MTRDTKDTIRRGRKGYPFADEARQLWDLGMFQKVSALAQHLRDKKREPHLSNKTVARWVQPLREREKGKLRSFPFQPLTQLVDSGQPVDWAWIAVLDLIAKQKRGNGLWAHEARWAMRLQRGLGELDPTLQWTLIEEYGFREEMRFISNQPTLYTADLDALVAFRPWTEEGVVDYYNAMNSKVIEGLSLFRSYPVELLEQAASQSDFKKFIDPDQRASEFLKNLTSGTSGARELRWPSYVARPWERMFQARAKMFQEGKGEE